MKEEASAAENHGFILFISQGHIYIDFALFTDIGYDLACVGASNIGLKIPFQEMFTGHPDQSITLTKASLVFKLLILFFPKSTTNMMVNSFYLDIRFVLL